MNPFQSFEDFKDQYEAAEEWLAELRGIGLELGHLEDESDYDGERYVLTPPEARLEIQAQEAQELAERAKREAARRIEYQSIWAAHRNRDIADCA